MKEQQLKRFNKIYPIYDGLSADLLFYFAIDSLYLQLVKNLSIAQITSLTSFSLIICILLQIPLLKIIKKIGNTYSVRISSFLLLISSILITFGKSYHILIIAQIIYEISFVFHMMNSVILKNNLELQNKSDEFIFIKTKASSIYALATFLISLIASLMFNLNNYLPMYACMLVCFICFILSFYIVDYSNGKNNKLENKTVSVKINIMQIIGLIVICYGLYMSIVMLGQKEGKLFIQEQLLNNYNVNKVAIILGIILCVSRAVRVLANLVFKKIYVKLENKISIFLAKLLCLSFIFMILGFLIKNMILKIIIMSIGYFIILFVRDPFKNYINNLLLNCSNKNDQPFYLSVLELIAKIFKAIISLLFTAVLINNNLYNVIIILIILSILELSICYYMTKELKNC